MKKHLDYSGAMNEAARCLLCDDAPCFCGCPAGVSPKRFIRKIRFGNIKGAVRELKRANVLAGSCSYICPCQNTCMGKCTSEKLDSPINIIGLQKFVCEWERENGMIEPEPGTGTGSKVAVIGSGPSGLACAAELAVKGHKSVVFESSSELGGMLRQVIPAFRLPNEMLDFEIEFIKKLGVQFETGKEISDPKTLLGDDFKAVYIATGVGTSKKTGLIGEEKKNVYQALDFLAEQKKVAAELALLNSAKQALPLQGKRVVVVGGGDTAIDSARVSAKLGASVVMAYRRTRKDMPAYRPDISEAEEEGVELMFRTLPRSVLGGDVVQGLRAVKIRWEKSGRASDGYSVEGTEFTIPCDILILAVGQKLKSIFGLRESPHGYIAVDKNMMTSTPGIFAGGDIVSGPATAVAAVGAGKIAAGFINEFLK